MSETEQDALLDRIAQRRRREAIKTRTISLIACAIALAIVAVIVAP